MKTWIKRWLGITELENQEKISYDMEALRMNVYALRTMVGEAVATALAGEADSRWSYYYNDDCSRFNTNTLHQALKAAATEQAEAVAERCIETRIRSESFIDEVVERIKRKQI